MNNSNTLEKVLDRIDQYLVKYGYLLDGRFQFPTAEALFQSDEMQTDALEMTGDLLDILNGEG